MESSMSYFAGGPAKLPNKVLEKVSGDILSYSDTGVGILEITHRCDEYLHLLDKAIKNIRKLFNVPDNYHVCFIPGGATGQYAAVPLNIMGLHGKADYMVTGTWSEKAAAEAEKFGTVNRVLPPLAPYETIPDRSTWKFDSEASYLYYCENESVQGVEFSEPPVPPPGVPLVCDMTSNFGAVEVDISKFGIVFASAQKNMGTAGVTIVIIRDDLLSRPRHPHCPIIFDYRVVVKKNSNYNTPPVYASRINVVYTIGHGDSRRVDVEKKFVKEASEIGLKAVEGHWLVGGMRASVLNSVTIEDVQRLVKFMEKFQLRNSTHG